MIDSPCNLNRGFRSNQFSSVKSTAGPNTNCILRQFSSALDNLGHYVTTTASASNLDYAGVEGTNFSNIVMNLNMPNNNRSYMQNGFSSQ
jgi:hypothetical protein